MIYKDIKNIIFIMISTKSLIAVLAVSYIALTFAAELPAGRKLKCADDLKLKACYLESEDSSGVKTTYVKSCAKGKFCRETYFEDEDDGIKDNEKNPRLQEIGICVKPLKLGDEGDKCEVDQECKWGHCTDNKCKAVADGATCKRDRECSGISYCKYASSKDQSGVCTALVKIGGECTDDEECEWGSLCNKGKCVEKYSLADGELSDNDEVCQGGETMSSSTKGGRVCASDSKKDNTCKSDDGSSTPQCTYSLSTGITGESPEDHYYDCDQDKDGKWVCPLIESSAEFKNYLDVYRQTLKDMDDEDKAGITNEVTLNDKKVAEAYSEYWYHVQMNEADDCIKDFYLQLELSSSSLKFTLLSLVSLFLILA